jgi:hypothetical protein
MGDLFSRNGLFYFLPKVPVADGLPFVSHWMSLYIAGGRCGLDVRHAAAWNLLKSIAYYSSDTDALGFLSLIWGGFDTRKKKDHHLLLMWKTICGTVNVRAWGS